VSFCFCRAQAYAQRVVTAMIRKNSQAAVRKIFSKKFVGIEEVTAGLERNCNFSAPVMIG